MQCGFTQSPKAALYLFLVSLQTLLEVASGRSLFDTRPFLIKTRRSDPYSEQYFTPQNFNPDTDIQSYQPIERYDQYSNDQNILTDSYGNQVHHQINFPPDSSSFDSNPNQYPEQTSNSIADDAYSQYNQYNAPANRGTPFNNLPPSAPPVPSATPPPVQNYPQNYRNNYQQQQFPPEYSNTPPTSVPTGPSSYPPYPPFPPYDQNNYQKQPPAQQNPPAYKPTFAGPPTGAGEEYSIEPSISYQAQPATGPGYDQNYQNYPPSPVYGATNQNYSPPRPFDIPSPIIINSLQYPSGPSQTPAPRNVYERPFQNNYQYGVGRGVGSPAPPPLPNPPPLPPPSQPNYPQYNQFDPRYSNYPEVAHNDYTGYQSQSHAQIADSPRQNVFFDQSQPRGKSYRRPFSGASSNYIPRGPSKSQRKTYARGHQRVPPPNFRANNPPPFGPSFETPGPGQAYQTLPQKQAPDGSYIY
ncbi:unnamed protein product [Bemisia tabaci]|uniref:Uncharacterized protein n=1 Tax=Bemisia tabaci TaxID=7038 RepID=A0A9P0CDR6_BEMTA|nr:unnamed protein product [Bemisia tabaci]